MVKISSGIRILLALKSTTVRTACGVLLAALLGSATVRAQGPPADAINLSQVTVYNSPADIASWRVTTAITRLEMQPSNTGLAGISLVFERQGHFEGPTWIGWPPPDGVNNLPFLQEIQYTVWAVVNVNGQWYTSGFIEMWTGRPSTGAPILTDFARNWAYDGRWGPMQGHQPVVGEQMGFFVSAGDARGQRGPTGPRERSNVVLVSLPAGDNGVFTYPALAPVRTARSRVSTDFDGDGRADLGVYRPAAGTGFILLSGSGQAVGIGGGQSTDLPVPADYDGDGKADLAIFRPASGTWLIRYSSNGGTAAIQWGNALDVLVPGDYDGDGKADIAVFRPANGTWYISYSSTGTTAAFQWGNGLDVPVPGDYDGDGKTDLAVFRPATGTWYIQYSSTGTATGIQWGNALDVTVPGDYDGDGKTDVAVFRPSIGTWYIRYSSTGAATGTQWGNALDVPVPGDYDGDGKTDVAVFRPANGTWYFRYSATGTTAGIQWGNGDDIPMLKR
jgi:hypothetical protein